MCCVMACSLCAAVPPAKAEAADAVHKISQQKGSIGLTVCFDFPQTAAAVKSRDLKLTLSKSGAQAVVALNDGALSGNTLGLNPAQVSILQKNTAGYALTTENQIGYLEANISGLEQGNYTLSLEGRGYSSFSHPVRLDGYSQHVVLTTAGGAFALGDIDGSGMVDAKDRSLLSDYLGLQGNSECDLNDDGRIDIVDLVYLNRSLNLSPKTKTLDTALLAEMTVQTDGLLVNNAANFQPLDALFTENETPVTVSPAVPGALSIPITLAEPAEISQIDIATPSAGDGAIITGSVELLLENGSSMKVDFDQTLPEGTHAIGPKADRNVISIPLGKKVAVKKITITVTKVTGQSGETPEFAVLTQIEFLKDIVSDSLQADNDKVKAVKAVSGDGSVTLSWNSVHNVTGYSVAYGTSRDALKQTASAKTNSISISGLKNETTYYFQVTAVNGSWKGTPSDIISEVPHAVKVPGAPSNIRVEPADQALRVSWGSTKDATMYQVFYRPAGESTFTAFGGSLTATNAVITGLTNGTSYDIAVKAGNAKGFGPYSAIAVGIPKQETLEMPDLPLTDRIDNSHVTSIVMADKSNVNTSLCPNFTVNDLIDGNAGTYWIAKNWSLNSTITFTFDAPQDMNYLLLVPYLDKAYRGRIDSYTVTAKDSEGKTLLETSSLPAPALTERNYLPITFPETKGIQSLSISLGEKTGGPRVSISEIAFYQSNSLLDDIAGLFSDSSFSALKPGVTAAQIQPLIEQLDAMADFYIDPTRLRAELTLALGLANGNTDSLGLVRSGFQSRSAAKDSQYGQSASDFQPVGISALAGSSVSVYADLPDDSPVYIVPTQFFGESGVWKGGAIQLRSGRNYIKTPKIGDLKDPRGGMYYLTYAGSHPESIKLHILESKDVYQIPVLELSNWYRMTLDERTSTIEAYVAKLRALAISGDPQTSIQNATEISTPSVLLSLPADRVLAGLSSGDAVQTLYQNVLAWEEVLFVANKTQGIIDANASLDGYEYPMTTRQNIRYMRMFAGAFMYAAGNHVGVGYGSTSALVQGRPTANGSGGLFGWGIAHEIGHNMDKLGKAEITNNIYSLAVQAWDGADMQKQTRLANSWDKIYDKVSAGRPGAANNVFVQLGMYWQLHLAYDEKGSPLKFYNEFFRAWKAGEYSDYTYDERVALIASKVAGRDLNRFFTRWGMELGSSAQGIISSQYPEESRAIWYLNDDSYIKRLDGESGNVGSVDIAVNVTGNKAEITLTNTEGLLGCEILRDGEPIGFTGTGSYEDSLGEANNLTYRYSAVPVDILGNIGKAADEVEVRVAYDKTIAKDLYTVEVNGDVTTVTMKGDPIPIAGVKTEQSAENCTISVSADGETWADAYSGKITASAPAFFKKPGAPQEDTRFWMYDAKFVKIEGLSDENILLLDYPGDRIDFYEGAAVGYLKEAYEYGDGADETIPKDTLVILGTYRGDPVYNTVEIQASYHAGLDAEDPTVIERPMKGEAIMFAEIPADGAVSDTSDGFFLFVPDLDAERELNEADGVVYPLPEPSAGQDPQDQLVLETENGFPAEIRAILYRTDDPNSSDSRRETSKTLWLSFPSEDTFPLVELGSDQ